MKTISTKDKALLEYLESFLTARRRALFTKVLKERTKHITVVTEDVYHLHNTSAVMRNCEVFGIQDLHVVEEINRKEIDREIALGAQKWVTLHRHNHVKDCIARLRADKYRIVATTPHKEAHTLESFDISDKVALFFGQEVNGLSATVMEEADDYIYIPMLGFTESLNISVSAAIILQHLSAKMRKEVINWGLSIDDMHAVRLHWTRQMLKKVEMYEERFNLMYGK